MKKTALYKDTFREIRKSRNRFFSIMMIVCLGVGFFVGIKATAPSMRATAEQYFNDTSLMDLEIFSTTGFDDEDVNAIYDIEGVSKVMPSYTTDLILENELGSSVVRVSSLPGENSSFDTVNELTLLEGRMPEAADECLISGFEFIDQSYEIGDVITFDEMAGNNSADDIVSNRTYTVVGLIESSKYLSFSFGTSSIGDGTVSLYAFIPASNFEYPRFTEVYITLDCHSDGVTAFDQEYEDEILRITTSLETLGQERLEVYLEEISKEIEDAESEFNEQKTDSDEQLDDAKAQLDDAKAELDQARQDIVDGWADYERNSIETEARLADAQSEINSAKTRIAEGETLLADGQAEYDDALAQFNSEIASARTTLDDGWEEYNTNYADYESGLADYNEGLAEYEEGLAEYKEGLSEYNTAQSDYGELLSIYENRDQYLAELEASVNSDGVVTEEEQQMLDQAQSYVEQAETQLANMEVQLADAERQLKNAEAGLIEAKAKLDKAKAELTAAETELADARKELEDGEAEYTTKKSEGETELATSYNELQTKKQELADAKADLAQAESDLAAARTTAATSLAEAKQQLEDAEAQLSEGQAEYDDSYAEYLDSRIEATTAIEDGESRILNAKNNYSDIVAGKWYVFNRNDVIESYSGFNLDAERIDAIASIFPVFFLLIAALVCLTTMSRMIDEQRTQMGTYKALGYPSRDIAGKYIVYSAIACIIGSIIGQVVCIQVLPRAIFDAYSTLYRMPPLIITVPWMMSLISFLVALLCTVMVAWYSSYRELRVKAATLMRPKSPKIGKRIFLEKWPRLWNTLSFSKKITARNLFRFKARLTMTIVGIAGCMALVVAGFGLQDAINPIVDKQYGEICKYDMMIALKQSLSTEDAEILGAELNADSRINESMFMRYMSVTASRDADTAIKDIYVVVPANPDRLPDMNILRDLDSGDPINLTDEGVVITSKLAEILGIGAGDSINFTMDEKEYALPVTAVTENYVYHYIYISVGLYEAAFDSSIQYNTVVAIASDSLTDFNAFISDWLNKDVGILSVMDLSIAKQAFGDTIDSLNIVVVIMLLSAGALAFVVVYNLTNINISERLREIATIKVLGFTHRETNMYIFRENVLMGIAGILIGSVAGYFLAQFMISTLEVDLVMFYKKIDFTSFLSSALLTAFYICFVNLVMTRRIKNISMVESLKAVEQPHARYACMQNQLRRSAFMSSKTTDRTYYEFIPSQETLRLQQMNSFHKQVNQIPFYVLVNQKLDFDLLKSAVNIEIERNDCLRLRYTKRKGKKVQYFIPPYTLDNIPVADFTGKSQEEQDAYLSLDASTPLRYMKGDVFRVILFRSYDGRSGIYICVSHLNMDAMAVFLFFTDLIAVYLSLTNGTEMPRPLSSFEKGIQADLAYFQDAKKLEKDEKFYREFFLKDGKTFYAAAHGIEKLKQKRLKKKNPELRYLNSIDPIHDKSKILRFHLNKKKTEEFTKFCDDHLITYQNLIYLGLRTHLSKINDCVDDVFFYAVCNRRITLADKRSGGCRLQPLPLRTVIGKDMTFIAALQKVSQTQLTLYRHADYPFVRLNSLVKKIEHRNVGSNTVSMIFTCMPLQYTPPEGWEVEFGGYSTGRFAFILYSFTVPNLVDGGLDFYFNFRTYDISEQDITNLYHNAIRVIETGIANPDITIGELLSDVL